MKHLPWSNLFVGLNLMDNISGVFRMLNTQKIFRNPNYPKIINFDGVFSNILKNIQNLISETVKV